MGGYHGKYSFECFSHTRSVLLRNGNKAFDIPIRYPPYTESNLSLLRMAARIPDIPYIKPFRLVGFTIAVGVITAAIASLNVRGIPSSWIQIYII